MLFGVMMVSRLRKGGNKMANKITVGKFEIENGVLSGPAQYMAEQGNAKLDAIMAGNDTVFNMTAHLSPSVEIAVLVALQTDYAGWVGMKQAELWLK